VITPFDRRRRYPDISASTNKYGADFESGDSSYLGISDASGPGLGFGDSDFTIAFWWKPESMFDYNVVFSKAGANKHEYWFYSSVLGKPAFSMLNGVTTARGNVTGVNGDFVAGTWCFVVVYFDESAGANGTSYMELDDAAATSKALTGAVGTDDGPFQLGARTAVDALVGDGVMAYFGAWSRIVTAGEKTSLYNSGPIFRYSDLTSAQRVGLVCWWDLEEQTGSRVDSHTSGYSLTDYNSVARAEVVYP
jgi:hypothetical protein